MMFPPSPETKKFHIRSGVNFNALTCMSCKAFFRRNALRNKEMKCPFQDRCSVDKITRKFCSKCRLKKCFDSGMKKVTIFIVFVYVCRPAVEGREGGRRRENIIFQP